MKQGVKNILIIISVFTLFNSQAQESNTYVKKKNSLTINFGSSKKSRESYTKYINNIPDNYITDDNSDTVQIYRTTFENIDTLIHLSDKPYNIIYLFSHRCSSSIELFPDIIKFVNENSDKYKLIPVIGYRYNEVMEIRRYLKYLQYFKPLYILDTEIYGNRKNAFKRLDKMIKYMCSECDYKKMGFSSFLLIDSKGNIIGHTTWESKNAIEYIKSLTDEMTINNHL